MGYGLDSGPTVATGSAWAQGACTINADLRFKGAQTWKEAK